MKTTIDILKQLSSNFSYTFIIFDIFGEYQIFYVKEYQIEEFVFFRGVDVKDLIFNSTNIEINQIAISLMKKVENDFPTNIKFNGNIPYYVIF